MPFLNQRKGENDRRKYFMINLRERMLPTSAGVEPATSWSPVGRASNCATEAGVSAKIYLVLRLYGTSDVMMLYSGWSVTCIIPVYRQLTQIRKNVHSHGCCVYILGMPRDYCLEQRLVVHCTISLLPYNRNYPFTAASWPRGWGVCWSLYQPACLFTTVGNHVC